MNDESRTRYIAAAKMLQAKYPDEIIRIGGTPQEPTDHMVAAGANLIRDIQAEASENTVKKIWEVMWAASEDERTYRGEAA